jgi:hypothetical protein
MKFQDNNKYCESAMFHIHIEHKEFQNAYPPIITTNIWFSIVENRRGGGAVILEWDLAPSQ